MAIRQRQRGRPQGRSNSFQRRLTWREVETAFNHLFDVGLDNDEAERIVLRFRRARSQLLPLFSGMVISPYEQERLIALTCLSKMGGATTAKMLDDVLADLDVHEALKRDVRQLRESISPEPQPDEELDEEFEEAETELEAEAEGEEELEFESEPEGEPQAAEPEPEAEPEREAGRSRRRSRGRGRKRQPEPVVSLDPAVFEGAPEPFLAALDGPIEPLMAAFGQLPLPKRLSFIDRSGRLDDTRVLRFLLPLLETEEWALVQSALRAVATLGRVEALPVVEKLAADSGRKRVKLRAERVRDHLRELAEAGQQAEEAVEDVAPAPETEPPAPSRRSRPKPLRRGRGRVEEPEAVEPVEREPQARLDWGLREPAPPPPRPDQPTPLVAPERLPKLVACLASGISQSGRQLLRVYRQGEDGALQRLDAEVDEEFGWVGLDMVTDLPANQHRRDVEQALAAGRALAEVTVGYVRRRLQDASEQTTASARPLPRDTQPALAWVGSGRRTELTAEPPEAPSPIDQQGIERLLDHPLFTGWAVELRPEGEAMTRWMGTSGRRSASRIRRRLIDDVLDAWLASGQWHQLPDRLRRQALLLDRLGERELANLAGSIAAALTETSRPSDDLLLRELVYRGFQARLSEAQEGAERQRRHRLLAAARHRHARSAFRRGLRRR